MENFSKEFFDFIADNKNIDPNTLRLSLSKKNFGFDLDFALTQIECRKKHNIKLKDLLINPYFLFPDNLSGEQASHQAIAKFHSSLVTGGAKILDMTAGLGIDACYFAKNANKVDAVELNPKKSEILNYNANLLGLRNLKVINGDSVNFLKETQDIYDLIFVDPARRDPNNKRLYNLHDCNPDIIANQELLLSKASEVLIKSSPMLDISQTIRDFRNISTIMAIGVKGECKEILIKLNSKLDINNPSIIAEAIDLDNDGFSISRFSINYSPQIKESHEIRYLSTLQSIEGKYLLEPNAMVMKLSPWTEICNVFQSYKLAGSSHLFVSSEKPSGFPGRVTKIEQVLTNKDRKSISGLPASVISRNHPQSSDELRRILKLKEGDTNFIYATRVGNNPIMLLTSKSEPIAR